MIVKKKTLGIGAFVIAAVGGLAFVLVSFLGKQTKTALSENQSYVYAYVSEIRGNEITYTELDETIVTAYLKQQEEAEESAEEELKETDRSAERESGTENAGEMPRGEMPDIEAQNGENLSEEGAPSMGERPSDVSGQMGTDAITTLLPVGITVHTQTDTETSFQRLAAGDMIKMLVETTEDGEEVITEIWML